MRDFVKAILHSLGWIHQTLKGSSVRQENWESCWKKLLASHHDATVDAAADVGNADAR